MSNNTFLDDCPDLLRDFIFYMKTVRGRSARTADGYYIDLRTFFRYIKAIKVLEIKGSECPVHRYTFPDGHSIYLLAEGRLVNLGCATGHPNFVMSCSFSNQTLAQIKIAKEKLETAVYTLPKELDEEVARLHLSKLGAKLTELSQEQADYIGVCVDGPYKNEHYRY